MIKATITRRGGRYRELSQKGRRAALTLNVKTATEAAEVARQLVPVDTGALRASIAVLQNASTGSASLIAGGESAPYAEIIEWGSYNRAPIPFIYPAIMSTRRTRRQRAQSLRMFK